MGTNNRQRRAAKARKKAERRARAAAPNHRPRRHGGGDDASRAGAGRGAHEQRSELPGASGPAWRELEQRLHWLVEQVWASGWQPGELVREIRRSTRSAPALRLGRLLVAVDHARRPVASLHPRWHQQLVSLDLPEATAAAGWLAGAVRDDAEVDGDAVMALIGCLGALSPLPRLIPPPGGAPTDVDIDMGGIGDAGVDADDTVLERVRALLAKAESTPFPAEAEAFTAKAHELMTRHAIDAALVEGRTVPAGWATAVRIPIDEPYIDSKSLLLQVVAEHTRCRAVFHPRFAMSTLVGANRDLSAVELMFTSLLLQGQQALLAEGASVAAGSRQRSRGYRSAFLLAYANRIGERLAEVSADVAAEVSTSSGLDVLPVLADRQRVVDAEFDRLFSNLRRSRTRSSVDAAGWASGRRAADRARLGEPDLPGGARDALAS